MPGFVPGSPTPGRSTGAFPLSRNLEKQPRPARKQGCVFVSAAEPAGTGRARPGRSGQGLEELIEPVARADVSDDQLGAINPWNFRDSFACFSVGPGAGWPSAITCPEL